MLSLLFKFFLPLNTQIYKISIEWFFFDFFFINLSVILQPRIRLSSRNKKLFIWKSEVFSLLRKNLIETNNLTPNRKIRSVNYKYFVGTSSLKWNQFSLPAFRQSHYADFNNRSELKNLEWWISRLILDPPFLIKSRLTKFSICLLKSV